MDQQHFLRRACRELGLTYPQLAEEMGVSARTVGKWTLRPGSADRREMPLLAIRYILRMLDERKRELLARGDRAGAEVLDALGAQVDPARRAGSLRTFDALQRASARLAPAAYPRNKPRSFATAASKNAWERKEEARHARRIQAAVAGKR